MADYLKFLQDNFRRDTIFAILIMLGFNFAFYQYHKELGFDGTVVRAYVHLSFTLIVLMLEFIRRWFNTMPWLKPYGGFLWNSVNEEDNDPYCVKCKIPMSFRLDGVDSMQCPNCKNVAFIRDIDKNSRPSTLDVITPKARNRMRKLRKK
jgi:hypothetical protein